MHPSRRHYDRMPWTFKAVVVVVITTACWLAVWGVMGLLAHWVNGAKMQWPF